MVGHHVVQLPCDPAALGPHRRVGQQVPESGRLRMRIAEFFEEEKGRFPVVILQALQRVSHTDASLGPNVGGTEPSGLQKRAILEIYGLIVPDHGDTFKLKRLLIRRTRTMSILVRIGSPCRLLRLRPFESVRPSP
ncbi:hypothetical protein OHA77_35275 [Streptosporangium sp. NBC_01639]|uniref:hypothetical protein n=1 Tax=Streptosporangium sp. NBC_01639 TaxID=2975948 RepID=UPI00386A3435|nr:hypothetical protein OHA77_35275 [Streptosporangium sp. NBC_01639]